VTLGPVHQRCIYASLALVYLTGVAWMALRYGVTGERVLEDGWRIAQSWLLRAHGAAAMLMLVAAGSVLAAHVPSGWKLRRSLASGIGMLAALGVLTLTGWLLYYASGETLRAGSSLSHMALGAAAPLALVWHLVQRRRALAREQERKRNRRRRRLHPEDAAIHAPGAVGAGNHHAGEEENLERLRAGEQAPGEPGGEKAVVQALVGGKHPAGLRLLRRVAEDP
jgi:MFS family permease